MEGGRPENKRVKGWLGGLEGGLTQSSSQNCSTVRDMSAGYQKKYVSGEND